jgi:hypothetical protein
MKEKIRNILLRIIDFEPRPFREGFQVDSSSVNKAAEEIFNLLPKFIPVSERLPEADGYYPVVLQWKGKQLSIIYFHKGYWYWNEACVKEKQRRYSNVVAWTTESELLKLLPEDK